MLQNRWGYSQKDWKAQHKLHSMASKGETNYQTGTANLTQDFKYLRCNNNTKEEGDYKGMRKVRVWESQSHTAAVKVPKIPRFKLRHGNESNRKTKALNTAINSYKEKNWRRRSAYFEATVTKLLILLFFWGGTDRLSHFLQLSTNWAELLEGMGERLFFSTTK